MAIHGLPGAHDLKDMEIIMDTLTAQYTEAEVLEEEPPEDLEFLAHQLMHPERRAQHRAHRRRKLPGLPSSSRIRWRLTLASNGTV